MAAALRLAAEMSGDKEGGDTSRALAAPSPLHTKVIVHPIVLLSVVDHCALPLPSPRHHAFAQRMFMRGCWLPACAPPPGVWIFGVSRPLTVFLTPPLSDNRLAKDTKKRVVGMLLGSVSKGVVDITNCYAVPFEEDERDLNIWYLDHSYHEQVRVSACLFAAGLQLHCTAPFSIVLALTAAT